MVTTDMRAPSMFCIINPEISTVALFRILSMKAADMLHRSTMFFSINLEVSHSTVTHTKVRMKKVADTLRSTACFSIRPKRLTRTGKCHHISAVFLMCETKRLCCRER